MNDTFNYDPDSDQSYGIDRKDGQGCEARSLEFIDLLIDKSIKILKNKSYRPKIQDALRAIRLKEKVFKGSQNEKAFWNMLQELREEQAQIQNPESKSEPVDLESRIIDTIKSLYYQVNNGVLPVKTITDYFNYGKPDEIRLSDSRMGRMLSNMGFRKTRIANGRSAIFWDDQLLSNGFGVQPECGSLSERSGNPAEGGTSANNALSQAAPESCQTDPLDLRYTLPPPKSLPKEIISSDSKSSVSNVCNSLPDNNLKEK